MSEPATQNTELTRLSSLSESNDFNNKKLCWVCFGTEQEDEDSQVVWISPCRCRGTMKWVHEECLQRWIDETQERTNSSRVSCSQCKTYYTLCFPPNNIVVTMFDKYDKFLYILSPAVAITAVIGSIYWCCSSYGYISIVLVMGYEEGTNMINQLEAGMFFVALPVIPISLILAKLIKWEDYILRLWKQNVFRLPRPLNFLIEAPPAKPRANCDQLLFDPGLNEPLSCTRMICGALLLPSISFLIGNYIIPGVANSQWRRSLLGGLAFLLIKGAVKIYLRKSQYIRYSQRTIKNYPANSSKSNDDELNSCRHRSSMDGSSSDEYQSSYPATSGDSDYILDDGDLPRARGTRVLSMTIRI